MVARGSQSARHCRQPLPERPVESAAFATSPPAGRRPPVAGHATRRWNASSQYSPSREGPSAAMSRPAVAPAPACREWNISAARRSSVFESAAAASEARRSEERPLAARVRLCQSRPLILYGPPQVGARSGHALLPDRRFVSSCRPVRLSPNCFTGLRSPRPDCTPRATAAAELRSHGAPRMPTAFKVAATLPPGVESSA